MILPVLIRPAELYVIRKAISEFKKLFGMENNMPFYGKVLAVYTIVRYKMKI